MRGGVDICTILNFYGLMQVDHELPEFGLHVIFGLAAMGIENRIEGHLGSKVFLLEVVRLFLELLQRVDTAVFKTKLASAHQALGTVPVVLRGGSSGRVQTGSMVSKLAAITNENRRFVV